MNHYAVWDDMDRGRFVSSDRLSQVLNYMVGNGWVLDDDDTRYDVEGDVCTVDGRVVAERTGRGWEGVSDGC